MLVVDPKFRISAEEAFNHEWFKNNQEDVAINTEVIKNIQKFHVLKNKIKKYLGD